MQDNNQAGSLDSMALIVVLVLVLVFSLGFGYWAFTGRQDYKNKSDAKSAAAVASAKKNQADQLQAQFNEQSKSPTKTYTGPTTYGTVSFNYPKTWSGYVDESDSSEPINGYFNPGVVPGITSNASFPLRVELVADSYSDVVQQLSSSSTAGGAAASAYIPPKMVGVANVQPGTRFDGVIAQNDSGGVQGSMVVIKVRDKTLKIYEMGTDNLADFNNIVLPSLTFIP